MAMMTGDVATGIYSPNYDLKVEANYNMGGEAKSINTPLIREFYNANVSLPLMLNNMKYTGGFGPGKPADPSRGVIVAPGSAISLRVSMAVNIGFLTTIKVGGNVQGIEQTITSGLANRFDEVHSTPKELTTTRDVWYSGSGTEKLIIVDYWKDAMLSGIPKEAAQGYFVVNVTTTPIKKIDYSFKGDNPPPPKSLSIGQVSEPTDLRGSFSPASGAQQIEVDVSKGHVGHGEDVDREYSWSYHKLELDETKARTLNFMVLVVPVSKIDKWKVTDFRDADGLND